MAISDVKPTFTQIQLHLYIDNRLYVDVADEIVVLKQKRKLNSLVVRLLAEHIRMERKFDLLSE